jgi:hypothetical protein
MIEDLIDAVENHGCVGRVLLVTGEWLACVVEAVNDEEYLWLKTERYLDDDENLEHPFYDYYTLRHSAILGFRV